MFDYDDDYGSRPGETIGRMPVEKIAELLIKEAREYSLEYDCPLFDALSDVADEWQDLNQDAFELAERNLLKD